MGLSNFDTKMFEKAHEIAEESDFETFHLGAVITYKRHVVSMACNTKKTSPHQKYYNRRYRHFRKGTAPASHTLHAEMRALNLISYPLGKDMDWSKVNVYIYRVAPGLPNQRGLARPCPACMAALRDCGVRNIYYTTDSGFAYERID